MAPRSLGYKQLQQRMRRSLCYGSRRMRSLSLPLSVHINADLHEQKEEGGISELLVDYFDKYAPYDYMDMDFATSLARESCVDACTFLVAMVYMDRLRRADKQFFETTDPNEMYLSALVVASKYLHDGGLDEFVYNDEWAASSDRSTKRVNELELKLLDSLSWNINVRNTEFTRILDQVECWIARQSIFKRGFATYNEVKVLSDDPKFILDTLKSLVTILATITVIYSTFAISILLIPHLATSVNSTRPNNGNFPYY
ncbi:unnamed protein product [Anisakis simplex]|uniref:Protein CNPPD1 n=1 Tax=Anisakis simplex TaxID=6269 RepID=A0A158PPQ4_ANISI|nr:unnamed protein product [Anisakis simplex]